MSRVVFKERQDDMSSGKDHRGHIHKRVPDKNTGEGLRNVVVGLVLNSEPAATTVHLH
jgi:hypothetical protein